ncbi:sam-dependent methyltransferase YafE [Yersinia intermedia]|jgi:ubiquinone/menaquinone biosynthesis C-methylase UbiE|uniref:Methyltransferase domain-containing protein n=1 Tax=Yersinia intermedia TaxID=631 RepID=A0A0T9M6V3_YERIN|nr:methyltransferase domain-containing protein [Yersinia intermedia]EEQ18277.1 Methyltransferase type 11 [Yersinia intermedia ATCC 29909]MCB5297740.1 class I SAM-dependent methyltransferase [Yersinia intermedia]MCW8111582.1 class I SAM-dependent methyltransferase [Yersinia intermedia]MDA5480664.1 class I SAM-dependent methyltransferase [Yersinia intermedia]MDA5493759.1 class I SAM-dependent methyltransferase [Yersinia intermedia]
MTTQNSHKDAVERQFGDQANAYLTSAVHAQGKDLQRLTTLLQPHSDARLLDLGCGAGHASFTAAAVVKSVVSYDLSAQMLQVVSQAAMDKKLTNIDVQQGLAESLPFDDQSFDIVISRYSAHHWHDVGQALREVKRVLRPGGKVIFMDVVSPGHPVLDIYLQTVEVLRDTSHVRNYSPGEWLARVTDAGLVINEVTTDRLYLEFSSWIARMRTPQYFAIAIRELQKSASDGVIKHYEIQPDGSFTSDIMMIVAKCD